MKFFVRDLNHRILSAGFFYLPAGRALFLFLFLIIAFVTEAQIVRAKNFATIRPGETEASIIKKAAKLIPSTRQMNWQQLELTGFLHFGINTFTNKEWGDGSEDPKLFNPSDLDARQWVRTCREAGIRQVILTAKHHDGFCLWPSKYTEHSVKNSPWRGGKGDVVKEVAAACKEYGVGFGVYLSPWDRNSAYFGDSAKYNDYFVNQLTELLTQYGRVDEVWFDGANGEGPNGKKQVYDFNRWYSLIRRLQPEAVIAVMGPDLRWVGTESGYGRETEWSVVPLDVQIQENIAANSQKEAGFAPRNMMDDDLGSREKLLKAKSLIWYPAEIDVSIRPGWFYHPAEDGQVKTADKLMDIYFSSVGRNGVLLLNIPPDTRGLINDADIRNLNEWARTRKETFAANLLAGAKITSNGKHASAILDNNVFTHWTTKGKDTTAIIELQLAKRQSADVLLLQENLQVGQRIEKFLIEYNEDGEWKKLTEGTTVGYKRLLRFPETAISAIRIKILSSRLNPTLSEVGLYKQVK